jgi:hypothetical protein
VILRAEGDDSPLPAEPRRRWLNVAMGVLLLVAFVIAARRQPPVDPNAAASAIATSGDLGDSPDPDLGPDDTARFFPPLSRGTDDSGSPTTDGAPATTDPTATTRDPRVTATVAEPVMTIGRGQVSEPSATTSPVPVLVPVPVTDTIADTLSPPMTTQPRPDPLIVSRPIPELPQALPPAPPPPWAASTRTTGAGLVATDVGCASSTSAGALDAFFRERIGPVVGLDYQHVYPLGGSRWLWLFQDTFVDHSGSGQRLDQASFVHNTAMVQEGSCFTLFHGGAPGAPESFEPGTGERRLAKWFWPMGGEMSNGQLFVFWAEMEKDGYEPRAGDGLGWHPKRTWLAVYDPRTLARLSFQRAPNAGVYPIYGYAVQSEGDHTYLFGNTFEQNLAREGGFRNGPHSGTEMYLARVPRGQFGSSPEYRTADGWTTDASQAHPIMQRYWAENPLQPRYIAGQWVAATKVDGYWGERLAIDVAPAPWGPWTTTALDTMSPRNADPLMNTYHAHLLPWLDGGHLVVSISQNARDMRRDAWPFPHRYRLAFLHALLVPPPSSEPPPDSVSPGSVLPDPGSEESTTTTTVGDATTTPAAVDTAVPTTTVTDTVPPTTAPPVATTSTTTATTAATTTTTTIPPASPPTTSPPPQTTDTSTTVGDSTTTSTAPPTP